MNRAISVIVCTHNPREDYLRRVLEALKAQTLPKEQWQLLLIDNASKEPLAGRWDLDWHQGARHVREKELGLTPARLRGVQESDGELLVFVDDDNVLAPNYLVTALRIAGDWPMLGAWGGQKLAEFEVPPPVWSRPYWRMLAIVEIERDGWSNQGGAGAWPCGAGMCVRRTIAEKYAELTRTHPLRARLERRGESLMSGGDTDLVYVTYEAGYGSGLFVSLRLKHLIDKKRLTENYFARLSESMACSGIILEAIQNRLPVEPSLARTLINTGRALVSRRPERKIKLARIRGERLGRRIIAEYNIGNPS